MRCEYCFYHDVAERRAREDLGFMTEQTARTLIDKALRYAGGEPAAFVFQGGEPCLKGLAFFESFAAYVKSRNALNSPVFFGLQTNGLLIDESWARFLKSENFLVGLSLDGDLGANKFRKTPDGRNAYDQTAKAAALLKEYGVDFNILTVLTGDCADDIARIYKFFKSEGYGFLQFTPCLRPFGDKTESGLYMTVKQYANFLITLFQLYAKDYFRGNYVSVRYFDNLVRLYLGQPTEQCGMRGHCAFQYVVEADGDVYPCDFYCLDERQLGNVLTDDFEALRNGSAQKTFINESLQTAPRCIQCEFFSMCRGGGCRRIMESADYCVAYKEFFSACLPLFRLFKDEKPRGERG
jgi:uncharacterized protein